MDRTPNGHAPAPHNSETEGGDVAPVFVIGDRGLSSTDGKTTSKEGDFSSPAAKSRQASVTPAPKPTPAPTPARNEQPAPPPRPMHEPPSQPAFMSESEYMEQLDDGATGSLPLLVLAVAGAALTLILGYQGFAQAQWAGAAITLASAGFGLLLSGALAFGVAKLVAMMFGEDTGTTLELAGRVASFVVAGEVAILGLGWFIGPLFAMVVALPIALCLAVVLLGIDVFQAMVFTIAHMTIRFSLAMLMAGVLLGAMTA